MNSKIRENRAEKEKKKIFFLAIFIVFVLNAFVQAQDNSFENLYQLIEQKNFFKAREIYSTVKNDLSPERQKFVEAFLDNAFGKLTQSNKKIVELIEDQTALFHDTLKVALYAVKEDNSVKLYEYKEAKEAIEIMLEKYSDALSEKEIEYYKNNLIIWTALENQPKQIVTINESAKIKIKKDKFRMKNLPVSYGKDTLDFIFDTGANFSTVTLSVAEKFNMNILPVYFEGSGGAGGKFPVRIAVCPEFYLGNIKIQNAVFGVVDDKFFSFRILFVKYKVLGIIGYPVIEALKEVQLTKDEYFIVPQEETVFAGSNMAMKGLEPLISVEGNPYFFDTGAHTTLLYKPYYQANREEIETKYKLKTIGTISAGGKSKGKGYIINAKFTVLDKEITLNKVQVSNEYASNGNGLWGWIGRDMVDQFDITTINFNQMFIKFD